MKYYHIIHKPTRRHFYVQAVSVKNACKLIDCSQAECLVKQVSPRQIKATQTIDQLIANTPHPSAPTASILWEDI